MRTPAIRKSARTASVMTRRFLRLAIGPGRFYLGPHRGEPGVDRVPVEGVEPGGDVVRPLVLVLEVVGVLPDVDAEDGGQALHVWAVLVGVALDGHLAVLVDDQPGPSAAELTQARLLELLL